MSEIHWEESGGSYTLIWGGHVWTLEFDKREPGLRSKVDDADANLLCLHALAAARRCETQVFSPATLVNVERYRASVQATFAPKGWGGLTVRAAWSPSSGGGAVDLEVQASASSVGVLRDVEVFVQSLWGMNGGPDPSSPMARFVVPRDARCAALSYDGRETADRLRGLTTLPVGDGSPARAFTPPGVARGTYYVEMVQPNDAARQIRMEPSFPETSLLELEIVRYGLFGHDFEKGVVFRARMRAYLVTTGKYALTCARCTRVSSTSLLRSDRNATSRPERG